MRSLLAAAAALVIVAFPSAARAARPAPCAPPASATWSSSAPFAATPVTFGGTSLTVQNNQWDAPQGYGSLLWVSPSSWGTCSSAPSTGGGWPYPDISHYYPLHPLLSQLTAVRGSWSQSLPPAGAGQHFEAAYDIWLGGAPGSGATEVMLWTHATGEGTGGRAAGTISAGSATWRLYVNAAHHEAALVLPVARDKGSVSILAVLRALSRDHRTSLIVGADPALWYVQYGFEVHGTAGVAEPFTVSSYGLYTRP